LFKIAKRRTKKQNRTKNLNYSKDQIQLIASVIILFLFAILAVFYFSQKNTELSEEKAKESYTPSKIKTNFDPDKISQFDLKIDKIGIFASVIPNVDGTNQDIYNESLEKGVAHYKGTALPNSGSNIFIFGHSSTILGVGPYAKIFARLGELDPGDIIEINFNQNIYRYSVFKKEIVLSTDTSVLKPTEKEQLTLMTCWPVGTDKKRLVILAKRE